MGLLHFPELPMQPTAIAPSILSADFARLGEEVDNVLKAGADWVHFDVMDNHYVPNLTIGPLVCQAIRPHVQVPIDVHLMVKPVDRIIPDFAKAGANIITFHPEASEHIDRTLQLIRDHGCKAGLVFNPATPMHYLEHVMDKIDMILIMSVNPGFGGQSFIPEALKKIAIARRMIDESGRDIMLEVDGGIKAENIAAAAAAAAAAVTADLLAAAFPPGSITGAPKHQAMKVIAAHEPPRGAWCGALFHLDDARRLTASVLIRTASFEQDAEGWRFRTLAGAGIVADSVPACERAETEVKIRAMAEALAGDQSFSTTSPSRG